MAGFTAMTNLAELIPEITEGVDYIFQNAGIGRSLVTYKDVSNQPGKDVEFPIYTEVAASTSANETSTPTSHQMDISMATLTIAKRSVYVGLGDLTAKAMSDSPATVGEAMGMSMVKAIDASVFGVVSTTNYATSAGSTDLNLNITHCLNGLNLLEVNEVNTNINCVVHPRQYKTVRAAFAPVAARTSTTDIKIPNPVSDQIASSGFAGNAFGMDWYVTARVTSRTVDATADCDSGLIFSPRGIGFAFSWLYQAGVETIRSDEALSKLLLNWADSAGVIYSSGVATLYSTSA